MIISRSPYRISLFGGGTDYPAWYRRYGGSVLSLTINRYSYITCRFLPPFFNYKYRIRYFRREEVSSRAEIEHPVIRTALEYLDIDSGLDLVHHGDLPARSGLGSSSTFTVGLLHALYALKNQMPSKRQLALDAIKIEQEILKEHVGSQDQTAAAFGGVNRIDFGGVSEIDVNPLSVSPEALSNLESSMMLFFTGLTRQASDIAKVQIERIDVNKENLMRQMELVDEAQKILMLGNNDFKPLGELLNEQWLLKRRLVSGISNEMIDLSYAKAIRAGAWGGKLLGAGGGGFLLILASKDKHSEIKQALGDLLYVPARIDYLGSKIVYFSNE